jgi:hypothetical protein
MTDKEQLEYISMFLLKSSEPGAGFNGDWLRSYIARTWPEKEQEDNTGCVHEADHNCYLDGLLDVGPHGFQRDNLHPPRSRRGTGWRRTKSGSAS